jgi:hypothetical protein
MYIALYILQPMVVICLFTIVHLESVPRVLISSLYCPGNATNATTE